MTVEYCVSKYEVAESSKLEEEIEAMVPRLEALGLSFFSDEESSIQYVRYYANDTESLLLGVYENYLSSVCHFECINTEGPVRVLVDVLLSIVEDFRRRRRWLIPPPRRRETFSAAC